MKFDFLFGHIRKVQLLCHWPHVFFQVAEILYLYFEFLHILAPSIAKIPKCKGNAGMYKTNNTVNSENNWRQKNNVLECWINKFFYVFFDLRLKRGLKNNGRNDNSTWEKIT